MTTNIPTDVTLPYSLLFLSKSEELAVVRTGGENKN